MSPEKLHPLIEKVPKGSLAYKAGIRSGDRLVAINGREVSDSLDYIYECAEQFYDIEIERDGNLYETTIEAPEGQNPGIELEGFTVRTCKNNCVFCFVSQLPKGLRKPLYVKDEDYRMSFLYGNYVTLSNLSQSDRKRITEMRLSPLYISVHATEHALRKQMLGNPRIPDVMEELRFFASNGISFHTQIVLCPGYNDKSKLKRTIKDIASFYPQALSIAVVPVGLTGHQRNNLAPMDNEDAKRALNDIGVLQASFLKKYGENFLYAADELYIKAKARFPGISHYGELPQIENGVGMVALFRHQARRLGPPYKAPKKRFLTFTGESFYPYLKSFIAKLCKHGVDIRALPVRNRLFGQSVTVTGLLCGEDIVKGLKKYAREADVVLVPDVVLRAEGDLLLDDMTLKTIQKELGVGAVLFDSTPDGLLRAIEKTCK